MKSILGVLCLGVLSTFAIGTLAWSDEQATKAQKISALENEQNQIEASLGKAISDCRDQSTDVDQLRDCLDTPEVGRKKVRVKEIRAEIADLEQEGAKPHAARQFSQSAYDQIFQIEHTPIKEAEK